MIPEIKDGKNILDFIDPEIERKLTELEQEEEEEENQSIMEEFESDLDEEEKETLNEISVLKKQRKKDNAFERKRSGPKASKAIELENRSEEQVMLELSKKGLFWKQRKYRKKYYSQSILFYL